MKKILFTLFLLVFLVKPVFAEDATSKSFEINGHKYTLVPQQHEKIYSEGLAPELKGKLYGYVDESGNFVIQPQFQTVKDFSEGLAFVRTAKKFLIIDKFDNVIGKVDDNVDDFLDTDGDLTRVRANGKYGFINGTGQFVIKPEFNSSGCLSEGLIAVEVDGKWGFIDKVGKIVIKPTFNYANPFHEGRASVLIEKKWGFIDRTGKIVIEPKIDNSIKGFSEGVAIVKIDGKWVIIDKLGKTLSIIEGAGDNTNFMRWDCGFHEGLAHIHINNKDLLINKSGKTIKEIPYLIFGDFSQGLAKVKVEDKYGFIDKTGKLTIEPKFDMAGDFSTNGLAKVKVNDKYGYIDKAGKYIIPSQYSDAKDFSDGLAAVMLDGKWGYINNTGVFVIQPKYSGLGDAAGDFKKGKAIVNEGSLTGYIDKAGSFVILSPFTNNGGPFKNGLAVVQRENKYGFIDKTGKFVIEPQFDTAFAFSDGLARVGFKDNTAFFKQGYIDATGKMVIEPQFPMANDFKNGEAQVRIDKEWVIIDKTGKILRKANMEMSTRLAASTQPKINTKEQFNKIKTLIEGHKVSQAIKEIQKTSDNYKVLNNWLIANASDIEPIYMYLIAERLIDKNKKVAVFWYFEGRLRAYYDGFRCEDVSARSGLSFLSLLAPKTSKYIFDNIHSDIVYNAGIKAIAWDEKHPSTNSPMWIACHGISAFTGQIKFVPPDKWDAVHQEVVDSMKKNLEKYHTTK